MCLTFFGCIDKPNAPALPPRAVFGVSLEESLDVAQIGGLPAIVFRCIQYLEAKKAEQEEGIYRLSGSSAVIKSLKDRFNIGKLTPPLRSSSFETFRCRGRSVLLIVFVVTRCQRGTWIF